VQYYQDAALFGEEDGFYRRAWECNCDVQYYQDAALFCEEE